MDVDVSYLTDSRFRESIRNDLEELARCKTAKSWKAVHVLAGSIIEALLTDSLIADGIIDRENALKMSLSDVIDTCRKQQIITPTAADLSTVVKNYRNLIHPGRSMRTNETVGEESSEISCALTSMIIAEIAEIRRKKYGYTAEQLLTKVRSDEHSISLVPRLVNEVAEHELKRLLLDLIPVELERNRTDFNTGINHVLDDNLKKFHALCYAASSESVQKDTGEWFLKHIKTSDALTLEWKVLPLLRPQYTRSLNDDGRQLIRDYLLGKLEARDRDVPIGDAEVCAALAENVDQAMKMIEFMLRKSDVRLARDLLSNAVGNFPSVLENEILEKLRNELANIPSGATSSYWQRRKDLLETTVAMIEIPF